MFIVSYTVLDFLLKNEIEDHPEMGQFEINVRNKKLFDLVEPEMYQQLLTNLQKTAFSEDLKDAVVLLVKNKLEEMKNQQQ